MTMTMTSMQDGIGAQIVRSIKKHMDTAAYSEASRAIFRQCLPHVDEAVERICPVAMGAGRNGFFTSYGVTDACADADVLIIVATPDHGLVLSASEWPPLNPEGMKAIGKDEAATGNLLGGMLHIIEDYTTSADKEDEKFSLTLVAAVSALLNVQEKKAATDKLRKEIRATGLSAHRLPADWRHAARPHLSNAANAGAPPAQ